MSFLVSASYRVARGPKPSPSWLGSSASDSWSRLLRSIRRRGLVRLLFLVGVAAASGSLPACQSELPKAKGALAYTDNARRLYERALRAAEDKNWENATRMFNDVRREYSYSRYARLSELRLADLNYDQGKLAEATSAYKAFVHDYPNDPEVPYARFRIAKSEYETVSQSFLLPPLEERDLASVHDALSTIRSYLADFPDAEHAEDLRYMLEVVLGLLARHELYVGRYYLDQDRLDAAAGRANYALENFPRSGLEAEALLLLAEIRMKQKKPEEARQYLEQLLKTYSESPFSVPARKYLQRLGPAEPTASKRQSRAADSARF
ncbi:MAG TPA: outer membrane protein assembly factor BamD [Polyangiaceae bacterium]|nr:outer membrane protein assembly factor BamD [Polyangiaceae bacterium]